MSNPRKKMGRPKLPAGEARDVYPLRLSASERSLFEQAASKENETLPEWIRKHLTNAAKDIVLR